MEYTIDAKNKILGRVASRAAAILRGKNEAGFAPNKLADVKVEIININKIKVSGGKMKQKEYKSYSGYPGSLKLTPMEKMARTKGKKYIFEKAVMGMLPKNKLRKQMMKNLIISND